jgi:hypothetical protein
LLIDVLVDPGSLENGIDASILHLFINYVTVLLAFFLFLFVSLVNNLVRFPLLSLLFLSLLRSVQLIFILIVTDNFILIVVDGLPMIVVVIQGLLLQLHALIAV